MANLEDKQKAALAQGEAYTKALDLMKKIDPYREKESEDYKITVIWEKAEGMFKIQPEGDLQWSLPDEHENLHLEVAVQDHEDLRFIPELTVHASIFSSEGNEISSHYLPFLWHPFLYHYGGNLVIPKDGIYSAEIKINPALFGRHDEDKGKKYAAAVDIMFENLNFKTGVKEYGPE